MSFSFLGLFIIFLAILAHYRKKNTLAQKEVEETFWNREAEANNVRRKDISELPYITIPLDKFPIGISTQEEILDCEKKLESLSHMKILNLTGQSNTDLKLSYGPANLSLLSDYDQNFIQLARTLVNYAKYLVQFGYEEDARPVLEFGIACGSDISANYTMLAEYYKRHGRSGELQDLLEKAESLNSLMKPAIVEKLHLLMAEDSTTFSPSCHTM